MKPKKKQKQRIKEMEKRSSGKEMDMMEAYTDKPVQEEVSSSFWYMMSYLAYNFLIFYYLILYSAGEPHLCKFPREIKNMGVSYRASF